MLEIIKWMAKRNHAIQKVKRIDKEFLTIEDVASILSVCPKTVGSMLKDARNKLAHIKRDGLIRIESKDLREYLDKYRIEN